MVLKNMLNRLNNQHDIPKETTRSTLQRILPAQTYKKIFPAPDLAAAWTELCCKKILDATEEESLAEKFKIDGQEIKSILTVNL